MENRYANIFIDSWHTVLGSLSAKKILSTEVSPVQEQPTSGSIFVLMGIIGDVNGKVVMSLDAKAGKALASDMLGGMEVSDVDELVISAVGEICNMVMGTACSSISAPGTNVDITPPTVIANEEPPQQAEQPAYRISFRLEEIESIDFNVSIKHAAEDILGRVN